MPVRSAWHIHTCKITDEKDQSTNKRSTKNINRHACATLAPTDHKLIILEKKKEVIERRSVHGSAPGGRGVGLDGAGRVGVHWRGGAPGDRGGGLRAGVLGRLGAAGDLLGEGDGLRAAVRGGERRRGEGGEQQEGREGERARHGQGVR
uniref:Uncharacterized protein n=1 Tax=Aegilops tauschii subsp. strangulata TaxID=200361 RepID=A0A453L1G3_AEGTS